MKKNANRISYCYAAILKLKAADNLFQSCFDSKQSERIKAKPVDHELGSLKRRRTSRYNQTISDDSHLTFLPEIKCKSVFYSFHRRAAKGKHKNRITGQILYFIPVIQVYCFCDSRSIFFCWLKVSRPIRRRFRISLFVWRRTESFIDSVVCQNRQNELSEHLRLKAPNFRRDFPRNQIWQRPAFTVFLFTQLLGFFSYRVSPFYDFCNYLCFPRIVLSFNRFPVENQNKEKATLKNSIVGSYFF